jgi:hypothetical protein
VATPSVAEREFRRRDYGTVTAALFARRMKRLLVKKRNSYVPGAPGMVNVSVAELDPVGRIFRVPFR